MSLEVVEYLQEEATTLMDEVPNQKERWYKCHDDGEQEVSIRSKQD